VSFSTDKLLGGPQGGLIAGREDLIGTIRSHPLMRALRMGKVGLSMIEKTLGLYLDPARIDERIPLYQALSRPIDTLEAQARDIRDRILDASAEQTTEAEPGTEAERGTGMGGFQIRIEPDVSQIGAGSCPTVTRESRALVLKHESLTARQVAQSLRDGDPPVIARVHGESVRLDMRTVFPEDVESVVCALQRLIRSGNDGATSTRWSS